MAKAAAVYCAQVKKQLSCPGSVSRPFLRQLRNETELYCTDHDGQDVQSLCAAFGTPEAVAEAFLCELSAKTVTKCMGKQKAILVVTLIVVMLTMMAVCVLGLQNQILRQKIDDSGFVASVIYKEEIDSKPFWVPFQDSIFGQTDTVG